MVTVEDRASGCSTPVQKQSRPSILDRLWFGNRRRLAKSSFGIGTCSFSNIPLIADDVCRLPHRTTHECSCVSPLREAARVGRGSALSNDIEPLVAFGALCRLKAGTHAPVAFAGEFAELMSIGPAAGRILEQCRATLTEPRVGMSGV